MPRFWLMKSEPDVYSIEDLKRDGRTHWDGVRNYQARNLMRDEMQIGDKVLFYHSNADPPGVVGTALVVRGGYPDHTARDSNSKYYDSKETKENPRWYMVDIAFESKFPRQISLAEIRNNRELQQMVLVKRSRLSVQPVEEGEYQKIVQLGRLQPSVEE